MKVKEAGEVISKIKKLSFLKNSEHLESMLYLCSIVLGIVDFKERAFKMVVVSKVIYLLFRLEEGGHVVAVLDFKDFKEEGEGIVIRDVLIVLKVILWD